MLLCKNLSKWAPKQGSPLLGNSSATNRSLRSFSSLSTLSSPASLSRFLISRSTKQELRDKHRSILFVHNEIRTNSLGGVRTLFISSNRKLKELETRANAHPEDAVLQEKYLKELIKTKPLEVQKRFESGSYAMNEESERLYVLSLAKLNKYDKVRMQNFLQHSLSNTGSGGRGHEGSYNSGSSGYSSFFGSKPIPVTIQQSWWQTMMNLLMNPWTVLIVVLAVFYYSPKSGGGVDELFQVPRTHEMVTKPTTRFDDVKGSDEAKEELQEVVDFLKNPQKYTKLGAKLPKGVLLVGPPGTGKTLLARAVAGEAGVPFFTCSGSSFDEIFVGVGSKRIRQLFEDAKKHAPCIIFIDEIDSVGSRRTKSSFNSRDGTINQLLTEMDGFTQTTGIIILAATNFVESLDPALIRPGRFDRQISVSPPDLKGRKSIIDYYLSKTKPGPDIDSTIIARGTPGFTGADLANLVNIAAIKTALKGKSSIDMKAIDEAKDDVLMGVKKKGHKPLEELRVTAYHEGGHALVAHYTPGAMPVHKLTIIQRGNALGVTVQLPEDDMYSMSRKQMMARLAVMMGGRVAEEMIFGEDNVTSGASNDFQQATSLARAMVKKWGMSDKAGLVVWGKDEEMSESERKVVDEEVRKLLQQSYEHAKQTLQKHEKELHKVADALLENEILSGEQMAKIIGSQPKTSEKLTPIQGTRTVST